MASNTDNAKKDLFSWTDKHLLALCDILNEYVMKNGRAHPFKWVDLQSQFEKLVNLKLNSDKTLKNKFDAMKKDYNLWKYLKNEETGLGWNASTGKLDCSDEWWKKKIKENPAVKRFMKKQPSIELQDAWSQLFGDVVASGMDCVAPSMDNTPSSGAYHVTLDEDDGVADDDGVAVHAQAAPSSLCLENLENQERTFFSDFLNEVSQQDVSLPRSEEPNKIQKTTDNSSKHGQLKRKRRESSGSALFKEYLAKQDGNQQRFFELMESDFASHAKKVENYSIATAMGVVAEMENRGLMTTGSPLWLFAIDHFRDAANREIFLNIRNDEGRLAWLKYKKDDYTLRA